MLRNLSDPCNDSLKKERQGHQDFAYLNAVAVILHHVLDKLLRLVHVARLAQALLFPLPSTATTTTREMGLPVTVVTVMPAILSLHPGMT